MRQRESTKPYPPKKGALMGVEALAQAAYDIFASFGGIIRPHRAGWVDAQSESPFLPSLQTAQERLVRTAREVFFRIDVQLISENLHRGRCGRKNVQLAVLPPHSRIEPPQGPWFCVVASALASAPSFFAAVAATPAETAFSMMACSRSGELNAFRTSYSFESILTRVNSVMLPPLPVRRRQIWCLRQKRNASRWMQSTSMNLTSAPRR